MVTPGAGKPYALKSQIGLDLELLVQLLPIPIVIGMGGISGWVD